MPPITVTSSSLSSFRDCQRKYKYAYVLGRVRLAESEALAVGSAWHLAMEAYAKHIMRNQASGWEDAAAAGVLALKTRAAAIDPAEAAKLGAMIELYQPIYGGKKILAVEETFSTRIPGPNGRNVSGVRLMGKVDVLLETRAGPMVLDHKTTSSEIIGFGPYWQALQIDAQMALYCMAHKARGFIYDVVRKPGIRMSREDDKAAESKGISREEAFAERCRTIMSEQRDAYYQWREINYSPEELRENLEDVRQTIDVLKKSTKTGKYPRNCNACVGKYGACQYLDVCSGRASINDDSQFRNKASAHEELA